MQGWWERVWVGGRPWWILAVVQFGNLMPSMDGSMVAIALPSMAVGTGIPLSTLQWVATIYYLVSAVVVLIAGRLGDLLGRSRVFTFGFVLFTAASLGSATVPGLPGLLACRVLQAVGGACLVANGNAIITSTFTDGRRGFALGLNSTILAGGVALGFLVGGLLTDGFGWRSVFLVNLPVGAVAVALALRVLPARNGPAKAFRFDWVGSALLALAVCGLLVGLQRLGAQRAATAEVLGLLGGGAAALLALLAVERRTETPLLPLAVFGHRNVAVGLAAIALFCSLLAASGILLPLYLQGVLGVGAAQAGLALAPYSLTMCILAPFSGILAEKFNAAWMMAGGAVLAMAVSIGYVFLGVSAPLAAVALGQLLIGLAAGVFFAPNRVLLFAGLPDGLLGVVSGLMQLTRQLTYAAAIALSTLAVAVAVEPHGRLSDLSVGTVPPAARVAMTEAMGAVYVVLAGLLAGAAVLCLWHARTRRRAAARPLTPVRETSP
ncbi:MFS transporter [Azospirillum sp.]|uniref:MFS transporter n=1 Tax=Azospirillum sp. TaxID=34012 RepID=UPI003D740D22